MKHLMIVIALLAFAVSAQAKGRPYGAAGCGLGTLVMGKDGNQILGATTNGTSGSQTFGITSGTSNCTDDGTVAMNKQLPIFIEANQPALARDIARGSGETIVNLSELMGCTNAAMLATRLQNRYSEIFSTPQIEAKQVQANILMVVRQDAELAAACGRARLASN